MEMNAERWQRVKALFDASLDQPVEARSTWLVKTVPDDVSLRAEVESLIAAHESDLDRFESGPPAALVDGVIADEPLPAGSMAGPYRLTREIGRGGMGVVFEAHRDDDQYRKRVAVKTLFRGSGSDLILRRFRQERQILARLENPHIARLLDGGVTTDGQPYFAMELVDGVPITAHVEVKKLPVRDRLQLFIQVCGAVQYAHQNLVVHRDLKPGNILVATDGAVKLLDFGIAKLLGHTDEEPDENLTDVQGASPKTTAYASPEQIANEPLTTSTDVFSLGVVLYEMLSGRHPFNYDRPGLDEVRRRIRDVTPVAPSQVPGNSLGSLPRTLKSDLDSITLMALRKEPLRRYSSVVLLSEDIRRFLDGQPVLARPDSGLYRMNRLVRRNRAAVAGAVVALVVLVAGVAATLWQARVATQERDNARRAAAKAEGVSRFLQHTLGAADPSWYSTTTARPGAETTIGQILEAAGPRAEAELAESPDVLADVLRTVGRANQALRRGPISVQQIERARTLHASQLGPVHREVAIDEHEIGMAQLALGNFPKAEEWMRRSVATFRSARDTASDDYGRTLSDLGLVLSTLGRPADAEPWFRASAEHRWRFDSLSPANAILLGNLGLVLSQQGKLTEAEPVYRAALEAYKKHSREYYETGYTLGNLAVDLLLRGRMDEALPLVRQQIDVVTRTLGPRHVVVAYGWVNLARVQHARGEYDSAMVAAREAERIFTAASLPPDHPDFARTELIMGQILAAQGKLVEGERRLRHAVDIRSAKLAPHSPHTADAQLALGRLLSRTGRQAEAKVLATRAYETYRSRLAEQDPRLGLTKRLLDSLP
jgi:serine/threonine-protein kinase